MNKFIFTVVLMVSAIGGFAMAQGARGMGGGGISGQPIDGTVIKPKSVQASGTQDQFMCTATTAVCEVESNISAATMTATVPAFDIGPTVTPGVNDRLACFSYGPSGSKTRVMCVDDMGDVNMSRAYIGTPETANGARLHALSETTIYGPSNWTSNFSVFGRAAESGVSSGGVFIAYHTIDNEGMIGSLSPVTAWRPLTISASEWKFRQNGGATPIANITSTGAFNSAAVSGNQAFTCTNTGCRFSLGDTSKFWFLDAGNDEYNISNGLSVGSTLRLNNGILNARNGQQLTLGGAQVDGASSVGVILRSQNVYSTAGSKLVSVRNQNTEQASIDKDGLLRVNAANAAKPTCNATNRGKVFFLDGAAGVADTYEICGKSAADVYAWKTIVTF